MITLTPMPYAELPVAYRSMKTEFPDDERKPLMRLRQQYKAGVYDIWWLKEDGVRRGYAMLVRQRKLVLLDYLAMLEKGRGYGSLCLEELKKQYPDGILVEAEAVEEGLPAEIARQRERRLRFYRRAGFVPCRFKTDVFGVAYTILFWSKHPVADRERLCAREYYQIYKAQLPKKWLDAHVCVEGQPESNGGKDDEHSSNNPHG